MHYTPNGHIFIVIHQLNSVFFLFFLLCNWICHSKYYRYQFNNHLIILIIVMSIIKYMTVFCFYVARNTQHGHGTGGMYHTHKEAQAGKF